MKIDKNIQKKFANRTFKPSASAWERLSVKLDEQPKQKKIGWFFYIRAAASILLLVSIGFYLFSDAQKDFIPKNEVVISPLKMKVIDENIEKIIKEIPIEEAFVKKDKVDNQLTFKKNLIEKKKSDILSKNNKLQNFNIKIIPKKELSVFVLLEEVPIALSMQKQSTKKDIFKQDLNSSIKVNSDDLLYAVTHSSEEVRKYYAKYNVNRDDVLKTIRNQLQESNLKINPDTILAEVERTIDNDVFHNNFIKSLKRAVTDIAAVIASRNN